MEPTDLVYSKGQQETFTNPELKEYIGKQRNRGNGNVVQYEVEYHKRIASSFASFILTTIGLSLSSRKRKGADRIVYLRHQRQYTTDTGGVDTEHHLCYRSILLL